MGMADRGQLPQWMEDLGELAKKAMFELKNVDRATAQDETTETTKDDSLSKRIKVSEPSLHRLKGLTKHSAMSLSSMA